jgi:hypothetical protein
MVNTRTLLVQGCAEETARAVLLASIGSSKLPARNLGAVAQATRSSSRMSVCRWYVTARLASIQTGVCQSRSCHTGLNWPRGPRWVRMTGQRKCCFSSYVTHTRLSIYSNVCMTTGCSRRARTTLRCRPGPQSAFSRGAGSLPPDRRTTDPASNLQAFDPGATAQSALAAEANGRHRAA